MPPYHPDYAILSIFNAVSDGVLIVAPPEWRVKFANESAARSLDRSVDRLYGESLDTIFDGARGSCIAEVAQLTEKDGPESFRVEFISDGGTSRPINVKCCRVEVSGQTLVAVVFGPPLSHEPRSARRDPLTGLPDRDVLLERLSTLLTGERASDRQLALLFVDLDGFKRVNDRFGHLAGDCVLQEIGRRLGECVREGDHATRYGGDEFVVLLEGVAAREEIDPVVVRIQEALSRPIVVAGEEVWLTSSIGAALAAPHHQTAEDLLRDADREMYAAKRALA